MRTQLSSVPIVAAMATLLGDDSPRATLPLSLSGLEGWIPEYRSARSYYGGRKNARPFGNTKNSQRWRDWNRSAVQGNQIARAKAMARLGIR